MDQPSLANRGAVAAVDICQLLRSVAGAGSQLLMQCSKALCHLIRIDATGGVKPAGHDCIHFPRHTGRLDATPSLICQPRQSGIHRVRLLPAFGHRPAHRI